MPQTYPTIQSAIDAAAAGDTVLVAAGTYNETIDFRSKAVTVESESGAAATTINGNGVEAVVRMFVNVGEIPVLRGFTVRNGGASGSTDGAIDTSGGPALIEQNTITDNRSCGEGAINASFSAATIRDNLIVGNSQDWCSGGVGGAGVSIVGAGTVQLRNNMITGNTHGSGAGGVALFAAGTPTIDGNVIKDNVGWIGGGMSLVNQSDATITNNIIAGNRGAQGGGMYVSVPLGVRGPLVYNNTVAANQANNGLAAYATGFYAQTAFVNNILAGDGTAAVFECDGSYDPTLPIIRFNDVYNRGTGPAYAGSCPDQTGANGNISADPLFVDAAGGDFHIGLGPAVDAGTNADAPTIDIDGDARPIDGNGDGVATVDIGADEKLPGDADTVPPTITCAASPNTLWPPDHTLRAIAVDISARDNSGSVTVTLVSVVSNQADKGLGADDVLADIQGWATGTDDRSGQLRAERYQRQRVYTLTYEAADPAGNTATCQTTVTVPMKR
ncbi:right-handed parallel beta-helix repeat-containing protein [Asanoa sp. NPDC050611]|uniref:right-handed parallel beta-helix repeat-containing protein n=1 Tax=Asanoa sp. NPDC050611 TaxID=3157098 RepID=UPI0033FF6434